LLPSTMRMEMTSQNATQIFDNLVKIFKIVRSGELRAVVVSARTDAHVGPRGGGRPVIGWAANEKTPQRGASRRRPGLPRPPTRGAVGRGSPTGAPVRCSRTDARLLDRGGRSGTSV